MKKSELRNLINEEIKKIIIESYSSSITKWKDNSMLMELVNYIKDKTNFNNFMYQEFLSNEGETIDLKHPNSIDVFYSIAVNEAGKIYLNFYNKKIIKTQSLADPTKNYQTTSAYRFKSESKKLRNYYDNINKAKLAIDKYFNSLKEKKFPLI